MFRFRKCQIFVFVLIKLALMATFKNRTVIFQAEIYRPQKWEISRKLQCADLKNIELNIFTVKSDFNFDYQYDQP